MQDGVAPHLEWGWTHLLPLECYASGVENIRLDDGEHCPREVLYPELVLLADGYSGGTEQVEQHCAVVVGGLHDAVHVWNAQKVPMNFLIPAMVLSNVRVHLSEE